MAKISRGYKAFPHYLLSHIIDRWGRKLNISWGSFTGASGTEPRVDAVTDDNGVGIALHYTNALIDSITDPQGRTHMLMYSFVSGEAGPSSQKLTKVTVQGPGDHTKVTYVWQFDYQDTYPVSTGRADPDSAYGNKYTGDLVTRKIEPDGLITDYHYEPVFLVGGGNLRLTEDDWDGRIQEISWMDSSGSAYNPPVGPVKRTISRFLNGQNQSDMTFPGSVVVLYDYSGTDVSGVTDLATGRKWSYGYDTTHNLTGVASPRETLNVPLVQYDYLRDASGHITQVTEQVMQESGTTVGDLVITEFNNLNLPGRITARSRDQMHDQKTELWYDGLGFDSQGHPAMVTTGNLTKIVEAAGVTGTEQTTNISYTGPEGMWGLPNIVTNAVGGDSTFTYDHPTGRLLTSNSPENTALMAPNDPDTPRSTTTLQYNADGLPSLIQDPLLHQITVGYDAEAPGSANLIITLRHPTDPAMNARQLKLDPKGRLLRDQDEGQVQTLWSYNPQNQVVTVTRAAGTVDAATTLFHYSDKGDLDYFDPPKGSSNRVSFDYLRRNQDGSLYLNPDHSTWYEGQVTQILYPATARYPQGTAEYFGYDPMTGELAWRKKAGGGIISIDRDRLHRIKKITYPGDTGGTSFSVQVGTDMTPGYDEFGRITLTSDAIGTTTLGYDLLNRLMSVTPPGPQKGVTYDYVAEPTLHRWTTTATLAGYAAPYKYQEDSKGRLYQLVNPFNQTTTLHYDRDGKNISTMLPNGIVETRSYISPQDWLQQITIQQPNLPPDMPLERLTYDYLKPADGSFDYTGHLRHETDKMARTHTFLYDNRYQLTGETHPDFVSYVYGYDLNGNRTSRNQNGVIDYYGVDERNELMWVNRGSMNPPVHLQPMPYTLFSYDADGRLTARERQFDGGWHRDFSFFWDGDDNLRQVKNGNDPWLTATYNGDNLRVTKHDFIPSDHTYSWGLGGILHDSSNNTLFTPGVSQQVNGQDQFFDTDWLGSTRYLMDGSGATTLAWQRYDAFGERTVQFGPDFPSEFLFAGGWGYENEYSTAVEPGVGLQYLQNRYYDPALGRFISADPIGFDGGLNLYEYSDNDPVDQVDPSGLGPEDDEGGAESVIAGIQGSRRRAFRFVNGVGNVAQVGIEVGGSLNPITSAGLALNSLKKRDYLGAALGAAPLVGHGLKALPAVGQTGGSCESFLSQLTGRAKGLVSRIFGISRGPAFGNRAHAALKAEIEALGPSGLRAEISFLNGIEVPYGTPGAVRLDVIQGPAGMPTFVYDFKTGGAALKATRIQQIRAHLPAGYQNIPIIPIR